MNASRTALVALAAFYTRTFAQRTNPTTANLSLVAHRRGTIAQKLGSALAALAVICALASSAAASTITWNAPVAITTNGSASDVVTLGHTFEAQYAASSNSAGPQTVNGVTFQEGFTNYTGAGPTVQALQGFTTGNAAYNTILNGFAYDANNPNTLTINGLTPGLTYEVQLWGMDNRGCCGGRTESYTGGSNTSASYALNSDVSITGTFIADGTTQQLILVNGAGQFQTNLNAFAVTVPEPASFMLLGLGAIGLFVVARCRRRA